MNDIGLLLAALRREEEAKEYHRTAFTNQKALLGESNSHTVWTRSVLDTLD